jgi:hypothetical protein
VVMGSWRPGGGDAAPAEGCLAVLRAG